MGEPAIQNTSVLNTKTEDNESTLKKFNKTLTEELLFSICSPIGSLKEKVWRN